ALKQVLSELDSLDRALIVLRYLKSNTQQTTAEKLGMTQVQVSRRERTILARMREKLTG
ncbi:MAG: sigma-70 family RNA polymerase sigma factor, partial [Oscillospiraceae bacterium]|nr:sigma-70 family RNA polymerase sigma factor [Oscillospiraceae bacterium]